MDTHSTNDSVDYEIANERWLTIYRYFLVAAVAFSVIGFTKIILFYYGGESGGQLVSQSVLGIAEIGLFVFALWSLNRVGEKWVRTLHLCINGVAAIILVNGLAPILPYNILIRVGYIAVFPIDALVPWQLVFELSFHSLVQIATSIASLTFAAYFFFRWLKSAGPTPVTATDSQNTAPPAAEQQTDPWRKHRVWAGILTVLLGLLLGIFGLAFGQQMAFLSGVMSGVGPSGISIPLPVVAIVVGIIVGGLMFCGERGRGRPMVWLAAVTTPLLAISVNFREVFLLIVLATSIYLIWVLRITVPAKKDK